MDGDTRFGSKFSGGFVTSLLPANSGLVAEQERRWYAACTRSRHEKSVAAELVRRQVECFLPVQTVARQWNDRIRPVAMPLFSGYVFVRIPLREQLRVLQVPGLTRLVKFGVRPEPIPDSEIASVQQVILDSSVEPCSYLSAGTRVRITSGPLAGIEGRVMRHKGASDTLRVVVSINAIMRSVSVEVAASSVEELASTGVALAGLSAWGPHADGEKQSWKNL
jgi:transcription antitermination factor NusG